MIGDNIKKIRVEKRIPQSILASKTGMKQCQISKIENGTRKIAADELNLIAMALGVSVANILDTA